MAAYEDSVGDGYGGRDGPVHLSPAQKAYVDGLVEAAVTRALQRSAAAAPAAAPLAPASQEPTVVEVSNDLPEGLAGPWLSRHGYYPDHAQYQKLLKVYYKVQPGLRHWSETEKKVGLAVRNARSHLGRSLKAVMPSLFLHGQCPVRDDIMVRCLLRAVTCAQLITCCDMRSLNYLL